MILAHLQCSEISFSGSKGNSTQMQLGLEKLWLMFWAEIASLQASNPLN